MSTAASGCMHVHAITYWLQQWTIAVPFPRTKAAAIRLSQDHVGEKVHHTVSFLTEEMIDQVPLHNQEEFKASQLVVQHG